MKYEMCYNAVLGLSDRNIFQVLNRYKVAVAI